MFSMFALQAKTKTSKALSKINHSLFPTLPDEIWLLICAFLVDDVQTLIRLASVDRNLYQLNSAKRKELILKTYIRNLNRLELLLKIPEIDSASDNVESKPLATFSYLATQFSLTRDFRLISSAGETGIPASSLISAVISTPSNSEHFALSTNGDVYTLGLEGLLGLPCKNNTFFPYPLPGKAASISVGPRHVLFLLEDGRVFAYGDNTDNQLGLGLDQNGFIHDLTQVPISEKVIRIATSAQQTLFLTINKTVYACGFDHNLERYSEFSPLQKLSIWDDRSVISFAASSVAPTIFFTMNKDQWTWRGYGKPRHFENKLLEHTELKLEKGFITLYSVGNLSFSNHFTLFAIYPDKITVWHGSNQTTHTLAANLFKLIKPMVDCIASTQKTLGLYKSQLELEQEQDHSDALKPSVRATRF